MAETRQHNAIRSRIWLGGKFISRDPVPIQITPKRFEAKTRTSNLAMRVDRCFTMGGMPNVRNRRDFTLPWNDLREPAMLEHIDILSNIGQPFPLGLWKQEYDIFDGDGQNQTFYLQRRQLLYAPGGALPAVLFDDFPTRVVTYDKSYLDSTAVGTEYAADKILQVHQADIDTGDPYPDEVWMSIEGEQFGNLWVSKIRFGTAPADASDNVTIIYLPLYEVVLDNEQPRSYVQSLVEPRTLKLVEFG